jgi:hypothetical protein
MPGWRVLLEPDHEDVWFDYALQRTVLASLGPPLNAVVRQH